MAGPRINTGFGGNDANALPLSPEALISQLRVEYPSGPVTVQGIAQDVYPYRKNGIIVRVYGRLVLGGFSIGFSAPAGAAPVDQKPVIIHGTLTIRPISPEYEQRATHQLTVTGHVVGEWTPGEEESDFQEIPSRGERLALTDFAARHSLSELAVLCSGTAERDIAASLQRAGVTERPLFVKANFGSGDKFLEVLDGLPSQGIHALAVARGGGRGLDQIGGSRSVALSLVNKGLPFYTAIGHASDVVLLDKLADQVFHSPSELGAAWARICQDRWRQVAQQRKVANLERLLEEKDAEFDQRLAELGQQNGGLETKLMALQSKLVGVHRHGISLSWRLLLPVLGAGGALVWVRFFS